MTLEALISLRDDAERLIRTKASAQKQVLEKQLARISSYFDGGWKRKARERRGSLKGRKVAPKYRNPAKRSETWAGRGARPRWLQAALKKGHKIEEFAIAAKQRPERRLVPRKSHERGRHVFSMHL
jgi:DNA-binding protein H-NS